MIQCGTLNLIAIARIPLGMIIAPGQSKVSIMPSGILFKAGR